MERLGLGLGLGLEGENYFAVQYEMENREAVGNIIKGGIA